MGGIPLFLLFNPLEARRAELYTLLFTLQLASGLSFYWLVFIFTLDHFRPGFTQNYLLLSKLDFGLGIRLPSYFMGFKRLGYFGET